jgi:hypothetical protein
MNIYIYIFFSDDNSIIISIWWDMSLNHLKKFKKFRNEVKKLTEKSIEIFWWDRGGEYLS